METVLVVFVLLLLTVPDQLLTAYPELVLGITLTPNTSPATYVFAAQPGELAKEATGSDPPARGRG